MKVSRLLVLAAVFGLATSAGGATVFPVHTGTDFQWSMVDCGPVGTGAESLIGFILRVTNISGSSAKNPQAFDGHPDPNNPPGQTGITTPGGDGLHNEQYVTKAYTVTPSLTIWNVTWGIPASPIDSYFNLLDANLASVFAPSEPPAVTPSAEPPFYAGDWTGFNNALQGTFGLKGTNPSADWDLAYLVVPVGTPIRVDCQVSGADGVKEDFDFIFPGVCIPTPAALPFGFAGLLFLVRRR
jgi:hypothetical protein